MNGVPVNELKTQPFKAILDGLDMFFSMCDGVDLDADQRIALAKWIVQHLAGETIAWRDVDVELPDTDTTVLVFSPEADDPVWFGYYDASDEPLWRDVSGAQYLTTVTHWAPMPVGPKG